MPSAREIRRINLLKLIKDFGTQKALAERCDLATAHVSQMVTERRDMGNDVARRIERTLGLDDGWMDQSHTPHDAARIGVSPRPPRAAAREAYSDPELLRKIFDEIKAHCGGELPQNTEALGVVVAELYARVMLDRRKTDRALIKSILSRSIQEGLLHAFDGEGNAGSTTREVGDE